jgi:hypothetical protein
MLSLTVEAVQWIDRQNGKRSRVIEDLIRKQIAAEVA